MFFKEPIAANRVGICSRAGTFLLKYYRCIDFVNDVLLSSFDNLSDTKGHQLLVL